MLSLGIYNGIWKIEKSLCRRGKDSPIISLWRTYYLPAPNHSSAT